jgi:hypothetical protein
MVGTLGTSDWAGVIAIAQGALFSMANVACLENVNTNINFNEEILSRPEINVCQISAL